MALHPGDRNQRSCAPKLKQEDFMDCRWRMMMCPAQLDLWLSMIKSLPLRQGLKGLATSEETAAIATRNAEQLSFGVPFLYSETLWNGRIWKQRVSVEVGEREREGGMWLSGSSRVGLGRQKWFTCQTCLKSIYRAPSDCWVVCATTVLVGLSCNSGVCCNSLTS